MWPMGLLFLILIMLIEKTKLELEKLKLALELHYVCMTFVWHNFPLHMNSYWVKKLVVKIIPKCVKYVTLLIAKHFIYHSILRKCLISRKNLQGFFRRSIQQKIQYRPCLKNQQCNIMRVNRNRCQYCRCVLVKWLRFFLLNHWRWTLDQILSS